MQTIKCTYRLNDQNVKIMQHQKLIILMKNIKRFKKKMQKNVMDF